MTGMEQGNTSQMDYFEEERIASVKWNSHMKKVLNTLHSLQIDLDTFKSSVKWISDCRRIAKPDLTQAFVEDRSPKKIVRMSEEASSVKVTIP